MAVPKGKTSKSRSRMRRANHDRVAAKNVVWCYHCGARKLAHRVCLSCGTYRDRQVLAVVER